MIPRSRAAVVFLSGLALLLAVETTLAIHGSSVGLWNKLDPGRSPNAGVLAGTPRPIRVDEWGLTTPAVVSRTSANPPYSVTDDRWGAGKTPLVMSLPARHWSMLVRPQLWGYFLFDLERGFAFAWAMKAVLLCGGLFLLLVRLTDDIGVALLGTAWVFFSGFVQWWYSSPTMMPETIGCVAFALVAAHEVAFAPDRKRIVVGAFVLVVAALDFAMSLYPPFQVPLVWLGTFLFAGWIWEHRRERPWRIAWWFRLAAGGLAVVVVASALVVYLLELRDTLTILRNTAYPGARVATGGDLGWARLFGGSYGFFMGESNAPAAWDNVCEASNFVLLFPVALGAIAWRAARRRLVGGVAWCLAAFLALVLSWSLVGWPRILALATGFSVTHGPRPLVAIGLASVILCCTELSRRDDHENVKARVAISSCWIVFLAATAVAVSRATGDFATLARSIAIVVIGGLAGWLLLARRRWAFAACLLVPSIYAFGLVNPIAKGLGPILDAKLYGEVGKIAHDDPEGLWAVYGNEVVAADFFKAAGARVVNGTKVVPILDQMHVFDPDSASQPIYNRYAHIELAVPHGGFRGFELLHADTFRIDIEPNHPLWLKLGVRYVAFPFAATNPAFLAKADLVTSIPESGAWIYRLR